MKAKDGAVVLYGMVLDHEPKVKFVENKPTDIPDGYAVMVKTPGGFSSVKYAQNVVTDPNIGLPPVGTSVAMVARPYAWSQRDEGNFGFSFVRHLSMGDLDAIVTASGATQEAGATS